MQILRTSAKMLLVAIAFVITAVAIVAAGSALRAPQAAPTISHAGPTLEAVRSLSWLLTTRVTLADATAPRIIGVAGGMSAVLVIRGDALLGVDLEQARISDMNATTRSFVVDLPQPTVVQARVDHERTRIFAVQRHGLWILMRLDDVTRQLIDAGMKDAQETIARSAGEESILVGAREHAEHVLQAFATSLGWHVTVQWMPAK